MMRGRSDNLADLGVHKDLPGGGFDQKKGRTALAGAVHIFTGQRSVVVENLLF